MPELVSRSQRFYRVMNDLRIRSEQGLIIPMHFSESQEIIWKVVAPFLDNHKRMRFIVLKSRQVYSSTFFEALLFTRTIEQPGTQSLVLAQDLASSHALFNMAKRFYEHLPMPKFAPPKQNEIFLPFKTAPSVFKVVSAGVSAKGRGTTQTCVHASETAFWQHPEILTGLFQTMPDVDDTLWVIESTANGKQGDGRMFYEEWSRAISGDSDTTPIFVPWFAMQKYRGSRLARDPIPESEWDSEEKVLAKTFGIDGDQIAWKRYATQAKCQGQIEMFHQEYPATPEEAFIASGMPAFDRLALMEQSTNICPPLARGRMDFNQLTKKGAFKEDTSGEVRIWKFPLAGHQYVIGADTSEGLEREGPEDKQSPDASCAEVLDMSTLEQVASVHGQIAPWEFSCTLAAMGLWFNKAIVAIEVNNTGHAVQDHMIRTHLYPMLHPWRGKPDRVNRGRAKLYGWETNVYSRPLMIEAGRRCINKVLVTIHEAKLIDELNDFSRSDSGKYEAEAGHDDRVMAFLLALRSREENYYPAKVKLEVSDEITIPGVHVVEVLDDKATTRKHIGKVLRDAADKAAKGWMEL